MATPTLPSGSAPRPIAEVAADLGLTDSEWVPYGRDKGKVLLSALAASRGRPDGKLVLVSANTPTPPGAGKTTLTIGPGQPLWKLGTRAVFPLREPSTGPTLG